MSGEIIAQVTMSVSYIHVSFDPLDDTMLCATGFYGLVFLKINSKGSRAKIKPLPGSILSEGNSQEQHFGFHCWDGSHHVICCTNPPSHSSNVVDSESSLYLCAPLACEAAQEIRPGIPSAVVKLLSNKLYIIVGYENGSLAWVSHDDNRVKTQISMDSDITSLSTYDDSSKMLVGTTTGLHMVSPAPSAVDPPSSLRVCAFHNTDTVAISGLCSLGKRHVAVSCALDGTLLIWSYTQTCLPSSYKRIFNEPLTCIASCPNSCVVAVGSKSGVLRVISVSPETTTNANSIMKVFFQAHVFKSAISHAAFRKDGKFLVVASESGCICFLDASRPSFKVMGFNDMKQPVSSLSWSAFDDHVFLCTKGGGNIFQVRAPNVPGTSMILSNSDIQKRLIRTMYSALFIICDPRINQDKQCIFATTDKKLVRYLIPTAMHDPDQNSESSVTEPREEYKCHDKVTMCVSTSQQANMVATGGADGVVLLRSLDSLKQSTVLHGCDSIGSQGIAHLAFSFDGQYLLFSGGSVIWCHTVQAPSSEKRPSLVNNTPDLFDHSQLEEIVQNTLKNAADHCLEPTQTATKSGDSASLKEVSESLFKEGVHLVEQYHSLVLCNSELPTEQQLNSTQLCLNIKEREILQLKARERMETAISNLQNELAKKKYLIERIKKLYWESEQEHDLVVSSLGEGGKHQVANYPLQFLSPLEIDRRRQIVTLRQSEMKTLGEPLVSYKKKGGLFTGSLRWKSVMNEKAATLIPPILHTDHPAEEEQSGETCTTIEGDTEPLLRRLLYHPFDLNTPYRIHTQIQLLQCLIYDLKRDFNIEVGELLKCKRDVISALGSKVTRLHKLSSELNIAPSFSVPKLSDSETPECIFNPGQPNVEEDTAARNHEPVASPQESQSLARALEEMMRGTPDIKEARRTVEMGPLLTECLTKKDKGLSLTEEEARLLMEHEDRQQTYQAEKKKHTEELENELKTIEKAVLEAFNNFDQRLDILRKKRVTTDQLIFEDELEIVKLCMRMSIIEEISLQESRLTEQLEVLKKKKTKSQARVQELKGIVESINGEVSTKQEDNSSLDLSFQKFLGKRAEIRELAPFLLKVFQDRKKVNSNSRGPYFYDVKTSLAVSGILKVIPPIEELYLEDVDKPDSMDNESWQELLSLRDKKIKSEIELAQAVGTLKQAEESLAAAEIKNNQIKQTLDCTLSEMLKFKKQSLWSTENTEMILSLRQGQVEVDDSNVCGNFDDYLLMDMSPISDLNQHIRTLSSKKVKLLTKFMGVKHNIATLKWELQGLEMRIEEFQEQIKFFQLLRVTKNLQEILKPGCAEKERDSTNSQQQATAALERRAENGKKRYQAQVEDIKLKLSRLKAGTLVKAKENQSVSEDIEKRTVAVAEKKKLLLQQHPSATTAQVDTFQLFLRNKRLSEQVRQQAVQISEKKATLAKLRAGPEPMFELPPLSPSRQQVSTQSQSPMQKSRAKL
ncbi:cilia- and flagella-associated protein 43 [Pelomyxa schiedti]|nr:cilia- and flagella-associated protein 43 [Pelomyxa schiedti]